MMTDLEFKNGRAEVLLADGTVLSILSRDRDRVLRYHASLSPSSCDWIPTRATDTTYELARLANDLPFADSIPIPELEQYRVTEDPDDDQGDWCIYGYVPEEDLLNYIAAVGRAKENRS